MEKSGPLGTTLYPFNGYEIDPVGTIFKYIKIGIETFALKKGSQKFFYHNDHLGGVNVITRMDGTRAQLNEYDPWGQVSYSEGSIDPTHRFTGKELDPESGLYYYGGRYYDPELGRFISPDPFVPQPSDPQSLNRYSYVLNNPQTFIDPTGYSFWKAIGKFFKKIVGYIVGAIVTAATGNPFLGGLIGGAVQAAVNKQNILVGALVGAFTSGVLGTSLGGQEGDSTGLLWGTFAGVSAADLASNAAGNSSAGGGVSNCNCGVSSQSSFLAATPGLRVCIGIAVFSAVGPGQATGEGALARFGIPGHQPGTVAINPRAFGLPFPETSPGQQLTGAQRAEREQAQSTIALAVNQIQMFARGLRLHGGPASPYTVSDFGNVHIRNSPFTRFDIYGFPSQQAAVRFGRQAAEVMIIIPTFLSCPPETQER